MRGIKETMIGLSVLMGCLICCSCSSSQVRKDLSRIESLINERPDSALSAIRSIDTLLLRTRAEKAK